MTENDYIAEYVKQNYPNILGFEFIMWKTGKQVCNICNELLGALRDIFENDIPGLVALCAGKLAGTF